MISAEFMEGAWTTYTENIERGTALLKEQFEVWESPIR